MGFWLSCASFIVPSQAKISCFTFFSLWWFFSVFFFKNRVSENFAPLNTPPVPVEQKTHKLIDYHEVRKVFFLLQNYNHRHFFDAEKCTPSQDQAFSSVSVPVFDVGVVGVAS